jgi:hypothetical protein
LQNVFIFAKSRSVEKLAFLIPVILAPLFIAFLFFFAIAILNIACKVKNGLIKVIYTFFKKLVYFIPGILSGSYLPEIASKNVLIPSPSMKQ